jgi:hypothetical protein
MDEPKGREMTWTEAILEDIKVARLTQPNIAQLIAAVILAGEMESVDWKEVNAAITKRWSHSARNRVMTMAWKIVGQARSAQEGVK